MRVLELFCHVDDFCQTFLPHWEQVQRASGQQFRRRAGQLSVSNVMTLVIHVHHLRFRDVKPY
jgi:hypothetical protein